MVSWTPIQFLGPIGPEMAELWPKNVYPNIGVYAIFWP